MISNPQGDTILALLYDENDAKWLKFLPRLQENQAKWCPHNQTTNYRAFFVVNKSDSAPPSCNSQLLCYCVCHLSHIARGELAWNQGKSEKRGPSNKRFKKTYDAQTQSEIWKVVVGVREVTNRERESWQRSAKTQEEKRSKSNWDF